MQSQLNINVNIVKPVKDDELKKRYTEAIFKIIKKKVSPYYIESFINRLSYEIDSNDITYRGDSHESSSDL